MHNNNDTIQFMYICIYIYIIIIITIIISLVLMRFYLSPTPRALRLPQPDIFCSRLSHAAAKSPSLSHHLPGESGAAVDGNSKKGFQYLAFQLSLSFQKKKKNAQVSNYSNYSNLGSMALFFWKGRNE